MLIQFWSQPPSGLSTDPQNITSVAPGLVASRRQETGVETEDGNGYMDKGTRTSMSRRMRTSMRMRKGRDDPETDFGTASDTTFPAPPTLTIDDPL